MNRRNVLITIIAVILTIAAGVAVSKWYYSEKPNLTVLLRCRENSSGSLSISEITSEKTFENSKKFDLKNVCKNGRIEIENYRQGNAVEFILERDGSGGEKIKVNSEYGRDIHSDPHGFYVVLRLSDDPPYIKNDGI